MRNTIQRVSHQLLKIIILFNFACFVFFFFFLFHALFWFVFSYRSRRASQDVGRVTKPNENFSWMRLVVHFIIFLSYDLIHCNRHFACCGLNILYTQLYIFNVSFLSVNYRSKSRSVDHGITSPFDLETLRSKVDSQVEKNLDRGI